MRILAIVLAFVLITGDQPKPRPTSPQPVSAAETWHLAIPDAIQVGLNSPIPVGKFMIGAVEIPLDGFEPTPIAPEDREVKLTNFTGNSPVAMPKVPRPRTNDNPEPDTEWPLSLADATWLGLGNAEFLRVRPTADDSGIAIEPVDPDRSLWAFQAEVMTLVRSIEREYGALRQQWSALQLREAAVKQAEAILQEARNELNGSRGTVTPIDEIERALDGFRLELVSATSDVITTDRQLRNLLGLAPADGRVIIPATPATEARVAPDWAASVHAMNEAEPAIVEQTVITRLYVRQLILARNQLLSKLGPNECFRVKAIGKGGSQREPAPRGFDYLAIMTQMLIEYADLSTSKPCDSDDKPARASGLTWDNYGGGFRSPRPNVRQAQYQLIRQRGTLGGTIRLATDALSRTFREVETTHDQLEADRRASLLAHERAEAQRGFYREGRIDAGRLLEAISQGANAAVAEARSLASDNAALVAFEEAKGTLLEFDGIHLDGISKVDPCIKALASIPTSLSDGSQGLRLIEEGLNQSPYVYPALPFSSGLPPRNAQSMIP